MAGQIVLSDFSGGLNTRDSANEIAPNETPHALNWTLDTRGQAKLRNGCSRAATLPGTTGKGAGIFYSGALDKWLCTRYDSVGNTIKLYSRAGDLSGSWTDHGALTGVGPSDQDGGKYYGFCDFPGNPPKVAIATIGLGVHTWDGTTLSLVGTGKVGWSIALWQNRLWVAGYPVSDATGNPTRLFACKIGDPTTWTAPDLTTVDFRDKDAESLTALGVAGGALIVFKERSAYRVNDSATGSYTLIDPSAGCVGPHAITSSNGLLYTWGADGLYEWDGIGRGRNVGDKVRNFFETTATSTVCGGQLSNRVLFGLSTPTTFLIEFDSQQRWVMEHILSGTSGLLAFVSSFAQKDGDLYAACYAADALVKVFSETPGSDDGVYYTGNYFRTKWIQPGSGDLARILQAQIEGLVATARTTTLTMTVYKDWDTSSSVTYNLSVDLRGTSTDTQARRALVQSLGHARSFAFEFTAGVVDGEALLNSLSLTSVALET